jgi:collagenase-like PrtC family protease
MAVNFDVPILFSQSYINGLEKLLNREKDTIKSVYGSARFGRIGQARFSKKIPELKTNELQDYVSKINKLNIKFHYTLNSPWTNLKERNKKHKTQIINELRTLIDIGIDAFIVANPYLISLIQEEFPKIEIIASINLQTTTAYKFKSLLDYGCSSVVLDRPVNRNIAFLKKINNNAEKFSLLVNSTCLFDCPLQQYHANENGYFSSENIKNIENIENKEYCMSYCLPLIEKHPENILKSTWIRPEDIYKYEEIGVKNFKIQGRTLDPEILLNLIKAYLDRKTPNDDLFSLLSDKNKK